MNFIWIEDAELQFEFKPMKIALKSTEICTILILASLKDLKKIKTFEGLVTL